MTLPTKGTVSRNSTNDSGGGANASLSLTLGTASAGRLLVIHVGGFFASDAYATGLTIGGNAATEASSARATWASIAGNFRSQIFYLYDASATGSTTFAVTGTGANSVVAITCWEFTGTAASDPIGAVATRSASGTAQTYTLTTTAADSYAVCGGFALAYPGAPASGLTEDSDINVAGDSSSLGWAGSRACATATGYTVGCTVTSYFGFEGLAGSAVEILAAAEASGSTSVGILPGL